MGPKQVPPAVHYGNNLHLISWKQLEYCKPFRTKADALMMQVNFEVPTVEALIACPISCFIHFAANECSYSGTCYELVANWVHPLFLKAKTEASKEDNPNGNRP